MAKLLYVEDNEMNRDMLSRRLSRRGYEIIMAFDGQAGCGRYGNPLQSMLRATVWVGFWIQSRCNHIDRQESAQIKNMLQDQIMNPGSEISLDTGHLGRREGL